MIRFRTYVTALITAILIVFSVRAQSGEKALGNYTYDSSGNITIIGPDAEGNTNYFEYDSANRVIRFELRSSTQQVIHSELYEYDAFGNRTKVTSDGVASSAPAAVSTNRLTAANYDAAGNIVALDGVTYAYDPVGTLTTKTNSEGTAFYIYTADNERVGIEGVDSTWRYTVRDVDGKVLREYAASSWNGPLGWVEDYVYRDGQLAAAIRPTAQGGTRHFHLDHLGSPRFITSSTKEIYAEHDYFPFGKEITNPTQELDLGFDTPEPMKFTGHERDFAGSYSAPVLDYMHARYYDPQAGRFLSVDPGRDWDPREPQSWNLYSYVRNNPVNGRDPDGRFTDPISLVVETIAAPAAVMVVVETAIVVGVVYVVGYEYIGERPEPVAFPQEIFAEHTKGKRPSTKAKHEKGQGRRNKDRGNEKADDRRRPPRKRPKGHKGPWPKPTVVPVPIPDKQPAPAPVPPPQQPVPPQPEPKPKKEQERVPVLLSRLETEGRIDGDAGDTRNRCGSAIRRGSKIGEPQKGGSHKSGFAA